VEQELQQKRGIECLMHRGSYRIDDARSAGDSDSERATLAGSMPDETQKKSNQALWLGLLIVVLGVLSNGLYFLGVPAPPIPWISLLLPVVGMALVVAGVWRAFARPAVYRGKILGSLAAVLCTLILVASVAGFVISKRLPAPAAATPQVGQRVPDFTLSDSEGHAVSLSTLLSGSAGGAPPKAVLLVFYRGYW